MIELGLISGNINSNEQIDITNNFIIVNLDKELGWNSSIIEEIQVLWSIENENAFSGTWLALFNLYWILLFIINTTKNEIYFRP